MIISTTTRQLFSEFGYEEGLEVAKKCGFDAVDMGFMRDVIEKEEFTEENCEKTCKMLLKEVKKNDLYFNQAHAPYPSMRFRDTHETAEEYNKRRKPLSARSIKMAGMLGAKQIVVHPVDTTSRPDINQKEFNLEFFNSFVPVCREYNIKIAVENMWKHSQQFERIVANVCSFGRELADYFDALDERYFTVCLDVGHSSLVGQHANEAIYELGGKRLTALHIHDNDLKEDMHTIPYFGKMDWNAVMKALADIDYQGDLTFEVLTESFKIGRGNKELTKKYYELLALTGKELIKQFEEYKKEM